MCRSAAAAAALVCLLLAGGGDARSRATCPQDARLGSFAFVRSGALLVLDFGTCTTRTLVEHGGIRPEFSADDRFVAFGDGRVVATRGGRVLRPLGSGVDLHWAPRGDLLAGLTRGGAIVAGRVGEPPKRVAPAGWGATSLEWDRNGSLLAIGRSRFPPHASMGVDGR